MVLKKKYHIFQPLEKIIKEDFKTLIFLMKYFFVYIDEITKCKFLNTENIFIDGTHIKANANLKKSRNIVIEESSKFYQEVLNEEIKKDREFYKKKPEFKKES